MITEVTEQGVLFTFDELRMLLAAMGADEIEGVYMPEKELSEEECLQVVHHLVCCGILHTRENGFYIRGDIRKMLGIMVAPERTGIWNGDGQSCFCYWKEDNVVISERCWQKKETLRLKIFSEREWEKK